MFKGARKEYDRGEGHFFTANVLRDDVSIAQTVIVWTRHPAPNDGTYLRALLDLLRPAIDGIAKYIDSARDEHVEVLVNGVAIDPSADAAVLHMHVKYLRCLQIRLGTTSLVVEPTEPDVDSVMRTTSALLKEAARRVLPTHAYHPREHT